MVVFLTIILFKFTTHPKKMQSYFLRGSNGFFLTIILFKFTTHPKKMQSYLILNLMYIATVNFKLIDKN